ncbi:MAG TPA: flagellar biosynthesis protein FlhB [Steroidobacteraceae bacterium]
MADLDDRERTESPTQKRLDDARAKGQVPRSRDLNAAAVVLVGGLALYGLGSAIGGRLLAVMRDGLSMRGPEGFDDAQMLLRLGHAAAAAGLAAAPVLGLLLAAAILAPLAIGGWTFSSQALVPDFARLDPVAGFGRVFSVRGLIELGKALARVLLVALVAVVVLRKQFHSFSMLDIEPAPVAVSHALTLCGSALIALGGALAVIAIIDVPLALWQFHQAMRMSRQEIREENKESEGNPEMKSRVRRVQQAMARKRMMQEVPKADVVITNPTHYAVALRYDDARMRAPVVVAKGQDLIALRIREIALEHKVAIVEAPPLARALHAHCELGDAIPARLYAAVAKVLTYVYQLRTARRQGGPSPRPPTVELPAE